MIPGMTWQERMLQELAEQDMSLVDLARESGVDYGRIRGFAKGRGAHPRDDAQEKIAATLNVRIQWLRDNIPPKRIALAEVIVLRRYSPARDERHAPSAFAFIHHVLSTNELVGF